MVKTKEAKVEHPTNGLGKLGRRLRKQYQKLTGEKIRGIQDSAKATLKTYWIPLKKKSRAGVEYIYYKKIVDKIGLDKNKNENSENVGHDA